MLAANRRGRWIFLFGFQKNERENITPHELEALQELSSDFLRFSESNLDLAVTKQELLEIFYETEILIEELLHQNKTFGCSVLPCRQRIEIGAGRECGGIKKNIMYAGG